MKGDQEEICLPVVQAHKECADEGERSIEKL